MLRRDGFQRVSEENLQPFLVLQRVPLVLEVLRKLEMGDGIWSDQIFEAEDILEQMLANDQVGGAGVGASNLFENALEDFEEKRALYRMRSPEP